jgi:hypothetical protein
MVNMEKINPEKIVASVSIDTNDHEARIEKLSTGEAGQTILRISAWKEGWSRAQVLTLSEQHLIELLHKASHAGVLSHGFIGRLREKIEI